MEHPLENVVAWLEAGDAADYRAGVLLLQEHNGPRSLVSMLLRKESAGNREKLRYELVKLTCQGRLQEVAEVMNHFAEAVATAVPPVVAPLPEQPAPAEVPEALRPEVDKLTQLMQRVYNQRAQLSNRLADIDPATEGPRVVGEILALEKQYNALAEKRRRLLAGEAVAPEQPAPAEAATALVDRAQLVKDRQNLRSNISKARKKLDAATSAEKRSELEQKIAQMGVELAHLETQLALPQA